MSTVPPQVQLIDPDVARSASAGAGVRVSVFVAIAECAPFVVESKVAVIVPARTSTEAT